MFISNKERNGSCYLEFQFCKNNNPIKSNILDVDIIECWKYDSLLISDEDFDIFYELYSNIFDCALLLNGKKGFDFCGVNYYNPESKKRY